MQRFFIGVAFVTIASVIAVFAFTKWVIETLIESIVAIFE
jgi:hypothetical protein